MSSVLNTLHHEKFQALNEKYQAIKELNRLAEFEEALRQYYSLCEEAKQEKHHKMVMDCLSGICQSLGNLGRVNEIAQHLNEYREYYEQYGTEEDRLKYHSLIGYLCASIEDYETTIQHYETALTIARELNDCTRTTYLLIYLQGMHLNLQQLDQALVCTAQLKEMYQSNPEAFSTLSYCAYLLNYMTILIEREEIDEIPALMLEVEKVTGFEKLKREQMYVALLKGRYFEQKNILSKAIEQYELAYSYLIETKEAPYYKKVLHHLINSYKKLCQYERALYYAEVLNDYLECIERKNLQVKTIEMSRQLKLEEMESLVYVDTLTNLNNRRFLKEEDEKWLEQARMKHESIACAVIDMDNFKKINDTYGHLFGDKVIQHFAATLSDILEKDMFSARYGGDEFVILARNKEDYKAVFLRLFDELQYLPVNEEGVSVKIELSMGVYILSNVQKQTLSYMVKEADHALYHIKGSGKNNISFYH